MSSTTKYMNENGSVEVQVMREGSMFFTIKANNESVKKVYLRSPELTFIASMLFSHGYFDKYKCLHDLE